MVPSCQSEALGGLHASDKKLEEQSLLPLLPSYLFRSACRALQFPLQELHEQNRLLCFQQHRTLKDLAQQAKAFLKELKDRFGIDLLEREGQTPLDLDAVDETPETPAEEEESKSEEETPPSSQLVDHFFAAIKNKNK